MLQIAAFSTIVQLIAAANKEVNTIIRESQPSYFNQQYLYTVLKEKSQSQSNLSLTSSKYCIVKDTASLSASFRDTIKKAPWYSGCPLDSWLDAISAVRPSKRRMTFINIGCNKGYNFAIWMNRFITIDINASVWFEHVWRGDVLHKGVCDDYKDNHPSVLYTDTKELLLVGVDLNKQNLDIIYNQTSSGGWLQSKLRDDATVQLYLFHGAGGAGSEPVSVTPCVPGDERCSIGMATSSSSKVPTIAVDRLVLELRARNITETSIVDILMIDTEGHDPIVLQGARKSIHAGHIRCIIFEYHDVGVWSQHKLKHVVEHLDAAYYECYFLGGKGELYPISGACWHDNYEFNWWSNVMCIKKDDVWHNAVQKYRIVAV